ncbi:MAG TPA: hypothetical protein VGQ06_06335 [Gemmatimonadales bacterium]|jgi:hypothetical protein|nr:hypothetical protein [Gemmatimonadales bacterium]
MPRPIAHLGLVLITLCAATAVPLGAQESTTVGGYGEVHYTNPSGRNTPAEVNLRRFIVYLAHTFKDRLAFRSELEVEDAKVEGGSNGGEVALEQAFLDYRLSDRVTLRTGLVLPPVGIVNETHEPPTFNGVDRPAFDHDVIPTTWREIGVGVVGTVPVTEGLSYRLYLVNGLRAESFSAAEGIRGGRQEGREATFANPSLTGRLEWVRPGLRVGGSFWYGGTTAGDTLLGTGTFDAPVALFSADARYERGGLALRAVAVTIGVSDADTINGLYGTAVGSRISGAYAEAAYDVLRLLVRGTSQRLNAFVRHERYDTQADVPAGTTRDRGFARRITTLGLSYKPTWNTVFKGDYEVRRTAAGTGEGETLRLGVGYQF